MADLTKLTAELAGMKQKMVDRLVAQGDETIQPDDTMQTIVDHFDNLRTKIANQDKEITANGEYTADEGYTGLGKVTVDVKAEPVPKYGATIDNFLGDVDENGVLQNATSPQNIIFDKVKDIGGSETLAYKFTYGRTGQEVRCFFPDLEKITGYKAAYGLFYENYDIVLLSMPKLKVTSGYNALQYILHKATSLKILDLRRLQTISGASPYICYACGQLEKILLDSLKEVKADISKSFEFCPMTTFSFPSLTTVSSNSYFGSSYSGVFYSCSKLLEIHFRKDAQTVIEGLTAYSSKFGAANATIYFDLIGTITVNGVAYARNEPNSIYVEYDKTYVAWADESGNIVYTTAGAEPAVGTVVYSDEGTTQVGTVSAVA